MGLRRGIVNTGGLARSVLSRKKRSSLAMSIGSREANMDESFARTKRIYYGYDSNTMLRLQEPLTKLVDQPCTIMMKLKRWERKECKPNSLPVLHKMHVKVGDTVQLITGHEKGKVGEITRIFRHNSTVIIEGLNLKTKHTKSREQGESGQIVKIEGAIHSSNVMLYSKEKKVASRVGHKILEDGTRARYLIKTGEIIDGMENWKKAIKERKEKTVEKAS